MGQEHITTALQRALQNGTISHAYLFTGPRGTGKTSIARILAHEINGLPYDNDGAHLDIIEIDAASNRRIDEIRDLRDKVHIAPTSAKYKVYIIDEVHMLTKEAFNALLKTLEEPPAHVVFILATTEVHKLPQTIISRTQRYAFKPVDMPQVVAHLRELATKENIDISDDALELVARHGDGSFRDSISLLDQVRNSGEKVTLQDVQDVLGIAPKELIDAVVQALAAHDAVATAKIIQQLHVAGNDPAQVAKQLGEHLRAGLLANKPALPSEALLTLLAKLIEVPASANPRSYLEIALLDTVLSGAAPAATTAPPAPAPAAEPVKKVAHEAMAKAPAVVAPHPSALRKAASPAETVTAAPVTASNEAPNPAVWPDVLGAVKQKHNTLFSIVRMARPIFEAGKVTLECSFPFHQKRLNEPKNKEVLAGIIKQITGQDMQIVCTVGQGQQAEDIVPATPTLPPSDEVVHSVAAPAAPQNAAVNAISNIFGSAEVLES